MKHRDNPRSQNILKYSTLQYFEEYLNQIVADKFTRRYDMTAIKEKIIGAVIVMNDADAKFFWELIEKKFSPSQDDIEEMPDEIEHDPECHEFTREQDIDWDQKNLTIKRFY